MIVIIYQILFVVIIFGGLWAWRKCQNDRLYQLLSEQAQRRGGSVRKGAIMICPSLSFTFEGMNVSVFSTVRGKHTPPCTYVTCRPNFSKEFEIYLCREGLMEKMGKAFGGQDIKMHHQEFDKAFIVKSNDEQILRSIVSADVQAKLLAVKSFSPSVYLNPKLCQILIPKYLKNTEDYDKFIDLLLNLLMKLNY